MIRKTGILLSAALSLCGTVLYFRSESAFHRQGHDRYRIAAEGERLEGVRAMVPADAVLGYVTDGEASAAIKVAQYSLAPRLLDAGANHSLVLGEFSRPEEYARLSQPLGLRVERDFGNGVVLFRNERVR